MILRYIPYVQTNFVLGLDADDGRGAVRADQAVLDLTPGAFPAYSLLSAFGRAAPLNLEYQRAGGCCRSRSTSSNNNQAMNVRPKNYSWTEFYDHVDRPDALLVLLAGDRPARAARHRRDPALAERRARGLVGGLGPDRVSRRTIRRLLDTGRVERASSSRARDEPARVLYRLRAQGPRPLVDALPGARHARPQRVPQEFGRRADVTPLCTAAAVAARRPAQYP